VTTISMAFSESHVDERPYARLMSSFIGSEHYEILLEPEEISQSIEEVAWYFDDLFSDWGTVSTRLLYKKCRKHGIKVVLVGEGSVEVFGGYSIFEEAIKRKGPMLWRLFQLYRQYSGRRHGNYFQSFKRTMAKYLKESQDDL